MKHFFFFFLSFSALAQSNIVFEQINTNGTGCPQGTVTSIVSPDGTSMSLLFDEFRVEVPNYESAPAPTTGRGPRYNPPGANASIYESSKACNIAFTTTLPAGRMATSISISLQARGNTMTDAGIQSYFSTILVGHRGLANSVGPQVKVIEKKMWMGRTEVGEDWTTDTNVTVPLKSTCASSSNRSIKFELKNHLEAKIKNNDATKSGIVTVDSNDTRGLLTFTLSTAPCR
jgi:hypothetical protein